MHSGWSMRIKVDEYNEKHAESNKGVKYVSTAVDHVKDKSIDEETKCLIKQALPLMSSSCAGGLSFSLDLLLDEPYMVTINISKEDGIINGMIGYLKNVDLQNGPPIRIWLLFPDDPNVGRNLRRHYLNVFPAQVKSGWTPLSRASQTFNVEIGKKYTSVLAERRQFPVQFTRANTFYKFQGQTKSCMITDPTGYVSCGGFYTKITRSTTKTGTSIVGPFNEKHISVSPEVKLEMVLLRTEKTFTCVLPLPVQHADSVNIVVQKIQSLRLNFGYVKSSLVYKYADILIFCETLLSSSDESSNFALENFHLYPFDHDSISATQHAGIVVYVRGTISCFVNVNAIFIDEQKTIQCLFVTLNEYL